MQQRDTPSGTVAYSDSRSAWWTDKEGQLERLVPWAALLVAGIGLGVMVCATLVVRRRRLLPVVLLAGLMSSALLASCTAVWRETPRIDAAIAAAFIGLGAVAGGYALGSALLYLTARPLSARISPPAANAGDEAVGVIVLSDAEPEDYDPRAVTETLVMHEEGGAPLPPELAKPLVYVAERSRYGRLGGSPARATAREIVAALEQDLDASHVRAQVLEAFCDGGSLGHAVAELVSRGLRRIIIAPLSVAKTAAIRKSIEEVQTKETADAGVAIEVTDAVWCSRRITEMLTSRIATALLDDAQDTGVCLVSPGQPVELQDHDQRAVEQLTYFAERLRAEIISTGIAAERVRRAFLQWEEPDVAEVARHLSAVGAKRLVFVPMSFPAESTQTLLDLRYAADQAAHDTGASAVVLGAWGNDPAVVRALWELVTDALQRMES